MTGNINIDLLNRLENGVKIEEFEIVQCLSQTSKSIVFKVNAQNSPRPLVLKLYAGEIDSTYNKEQFLKEAKILKALPKHRNILPLVRIAQFEQRPFFIMDYLPQNLAEAVSENHQKLHFEASKKLMIDVLNGLECLHLHGVLHLDIKPQNILITDKGKAAISDLDCALILPSSPLYLKFKQEMSHKSISGLTVEYSSPDLIKFAQQQSQDTESREKKERPESLLKVQWDLYSVGAVFYRLLTGRPPTEVLTKDKDSIAINRIKNELNGLAPDSVVLIICDLLGLSEKQQFTSARDCIVALNNTVNEPEDYPTMCVDDLSDIQQSVTLEKQIDQILREHGHIPTERFDYLFSLLDIETKSSTQNSKLKLNALGGQNLNPAINMLVEERKDYLSQHEGLGAWLRWAEHILQLHNQKIVNKVNKTAKHNKKLKLSLEHFEGLLVQGHASLDSNKDRADKVLENYFYRQSKLSNFTHLNMIALSMFVIVLVALILIYQPFIHNPLNESSSYDLNKDVDANTKHSRHAVFDATEANTDFNQTPRLAEKLEPSEQDTRATHRLKDVISHPVNDSQLAVIEWQKVTGLNDALVMKHEVTQQLYQFCIDAGKCRPTRSIKRFSTSPDNIHQSPADNFQPGLPKVNVSWYEVTEQFIPWLSSQLDKSLTLPSLVQWQVIAERTLTQGKSPKFHCQDCKNRSEYQLVNSLIPVDAMSQDVNGLIHFYGNAREWLQDCWRNDLKQTDSHNLLNAVERCDQAIVAGGSFLNKQRELHPQQFDRLLKTASSSDVGFRLIWIQKEF